MRCLCCQKEINETESHNGWHKRCVRSFFGTTTLPSISLSNEDLEKLADDTVNKRLTIPGVQKKLSLHLSTEKEARLTLVDYPTGYILKPQAEEYTHLPEWEALEMHLAELTGIKTVPYALIHLAGNDLAYITKRIDRHIDVKTGQIQMYAMEDFCQLEGRLTIDKYHSSYERCAKVIQRYSYRPGIDLSEFFLRMLFCYVTGNSDMHLKNFSLIEEVPTTRKFYLSNAYDMLPVNLIVPEDEEEVALTLNGKKRNLTINDFKALASECKLAPKVFDRLLSRIISLEDTYISEIGKSLLSKKEQSEMTQLVSNRIARLKNK